MNLVITFLIALIPQNHATQRDGNHLRPDNGKA